MHIRLQSQSSGNYRILLNILDSGEETYLNLQVVLVLLGLKNWLKDLNLQEE